MRRFLITYWPILAILPIAYLISIVVAVVGQPWSAGDWGSNVVLATLITVATVVLARKQAQLQENAADLELDEKIAVLSGAINELQRERTAGRTCQVINDGRAGLNLIGSAHPDARTEYLGVLMRCLRKIEDMMTRNLELYTLWTEADWKTVADTVRRMTTPLARRPARMKGLDPATMTEIKSMIDRIDAIASSPSVPLYLLRRTYEGSGIRVQLNWTVLESSIVKIERHQWVGATELASRPLFAPWYQVEEGVDCAPEDEDADAVRLDGFDKWMPRMNPRRQARIEAIKSDMDHARPDRPYRFEIVTLDLWGDRLIVLDGNHRLAAAVLRDHGRAGTDGSVDFVEYRVHAELSVGLLRDLGWHLRARRDGLPTA